MAATQTGTSGPPEPACASSAGIPGEDVIEVQRTPAPGAARGAWRTFRETARGLKTTFGADPRRAR